MAKPKINKSSEARIDDEIIVDCYGEAERAMGWQCCKRQLKGGRR